MYKKCVVHEQSCCFAYWTYFFGLFFFWCCFCCWWWSFNLMLLQNKRTLLHLTLVLMVIRKAKGCSQRFFSLRSVASSLIKPLIVQKRNVSLQSTIRSPFDGLLVQWYIFLKFAFINWFLRTRPSFDMLKVILGYEACRNRTKELYNTLVIFKMISSVC